MCKSEAKFEVSELFNEKLKLLISSILKVKENK